MSASLENVGDTGGHEAKAALFDLFAEVGSALSAGRRVEIIDLLAQGERSVEDISREIDQTPANTSHHLRTLAAAGLVRSRREGTHIHYSLARAEVETLWKALREVAEATRAELSELADAYLGNIEDLEALTREQLLERIDDDAVVVVDVRPLHEYQAGHIQGAISIPLAELSRRLSEIPQDVPVVAYCRGPYCVFAPQAIRWLKSQGVSASRLQDGFPEWRREGLPIDRPSGRL